MLLAPIALAAAVPPVTYFAVRLGGHRLSRTAQAALFVAAAVAGLVAAFHFGPAALALPALAVLAAAALLISVIDGHLLVIPDALVVALGLAGLAWLDAREQFEPFDVVLGVVLGACIMAAILLYFVHVRGRAGLGLGDVKLMAAIGAIVGPAGVAVVIMVGSLATLCAYGGLFWLRRGRSRSPRIPFAPGLLAAMLVQLAIR